MNTFLAIIISLILSFGLYIGFVIVLKTERGNRFIGRHMMFHPNAICVWRVFIGIGGTLLYFLAGQEMLGILLFTVSATLDGVDGLVARECDLVTPLGEEIDPFCDKCTYLPPMFFFAYQGQLEWSLIWILFVSEFCGQFLVRYIIKRFTELSVQANNFGKIKAVLCFVLIIYCALLSGDFHLPNITEQILYVCIVLSVASSAFKVIGNRFYADILSVLNLSCGIAGIFLLFRGRYVFATIAVLTGQIFDLFDGRMAEKHGGTRIGPLLDDIADLVSFGVCPGLLIVFHGGKTPSSIVLGTIYLFSVGYRLWRYLVRDKHDKTIPSGTFNGLPSPAGAMIALGACLFWKDYRILWVFILLTSYLLVSHIRFVHFGRVILQRIPRGLMVLFGFVVVFLIAYLFKTKDPETLGGVLLIFSMTYMLTSTGRVMKKIL